MNTSTKPVWRTPFSYPLARNLEDRQIRYEDRDSLLQHGTKKICQVVEEGVGNTRMNEREGLTGFPWPTPVLGSGCLAIESDSAVSAQSLAEGVRRQLGTRPTPSGYQSPAEVAGDFVQHMFRDRVRPSDVARPTDGGYPAGGPDDRRAEAQDVSLRAALLILVAARLTRFYHLIKADQLQPPSRWEGESVVYDAATANAYAQNIRWSSIGPIMEELDEVIGLFQTPDEDHGPAVSALVSRVLREVRSGFRGEGHCSQLRQDHLRLMTELAWQFLTVRTDIYPGWTDTMLWLLLQEGGAATRSLFAKRRPLFRDVTTVEEAISRLLMPSTAASFERSLDADPTPRTAFYDAVAALLLAQAAAGEKREADRREGRSVGGPDQGIGFPPATAFVTSFDLELEMALWRAGEPFSVVLPVHVHQESGRAALIWLVGDVEPTRQRRAADELAALRTGVEGSWRIAMEGMGSSIGHRPIVVRLAGSPLMELPRQGVIASDLERVGMPITRAGDRWTTQLLHAVTVDEYTALQRSAAEHASHHAKPRDADVKRSSLPRSFIGNDGSGVRRYWLVLGVQVADSAVRYQLFNQLYRGVTESEPTAAARAGRPAAGRESAPPGSSMFGAPPPGAQPQPEGDGDEEEAADLIMGGLAINHRIDDDDAALLYWLEFSIVQDDCARFIADLDHYRCHIEHPHSRPKGMGCAIGDRT